MTRLASGTRSILPLLWLACVAASCSGAPSAPTGDVAGPLRLTAAIAQTSLAPSDETILAFTLENRGTSDLVLTFPSGCQILPYIRSRGAFVYPSDGRWACTTAITMLPLQAGASITRDLRVRASAAADIPVVALAPGDYTAHAKVDSTEYHLASREVTFTVR